jgi:hypothetical protein
MPSGLIIFITDPVRSAPDRDIAAVQQYVMPWCPPAQPPTDRPDNCQRQHRAVVSRITTIDAETARR